MTAQPRSRYTSGFSLFELMICIGILGILLGIVLPSVLAGDDFKTTKDRRNAQELVSVCTCAQVAGLNFIISDDVGATIENLRMGGAPTEGSFKGRKFYIAGMKDEDAEGASRFLDIESGILVYRHDKRS
jgi:prepilin-type N-terminal cleavage/methylation domain-containing protein